MRISLTTKTVLGVAAALVAVSACSDEAKSDVATLIACERAEDLQEALEEIVEEVDDNDLEDALEEIADLRSDFASLSSRVDTIGGTESETLAPLIAEAETAIAGLGAATDIPGIQSALDAGQSAIESLASTVESTLDCDD